MNKGKAMRKTSRDNRDVFAVFKKDSFMKDATFGEKFGYWFKNVFVPHLAFKTVVFIAVAILGTMLVVDIMSDKTNDFDYIVGGDIFADIDQMNELTDYMKDILADDGKEIKIGDQMLCTKNIQEADETLLGADEFNQANVEKIKISMADDEVLLFFFDRTLMEMYADEGAFLPLSEFGIESDNKYFVRVDNTPVFERIGMNYIDGIYAGIKMKNKARSEDERILEKYEKAGIVLKGILEGE